MEGLLQTALLFVFLLVEKPECKNALPERIKWWKTKEYGLEITGDVHEDINLEGHEKWTQTKVYHFGRDQMKTGVDNLIHTNRVKGFPDFTIHKLDPISYEFEEKKMLVTFTNVKMINLDTYDVDAAIYSQLGIYQRGDHEIDEVTYENIEKVKKQKKVSKLFKRINKKNEKYILDRRDVKWTINIGANFQTVDPKTKKLQPIIIETDFKIQPDKEYANSATDDPEVLRSRGKLRLEFHYFEFGLELIITEIDEPLVPFLPESMKSFNLTPDFDVDYKIQDIKILEDRIRLLPYDKDDEFIKKINVKEDVNANLPEENQKPAKEIVPPLEETNFYVNEEEKKLVARHFEFIAKLIRKNPADISRRMCLNLIPKMAWKIMHMEKKMQLPYLFHEILTYDDEFKEKLGLEPFTNMDLFNQTVNMFRGWTGLYFGRTKSAPATLGD